MASQFLKLISDTVSKCPEENVYFTHLEPFSWSYIINPFMLNVRFNEHGIFDQFSMHKFWQKGFLLRQAFR